MPEASDATRMKFVRRALRRQPDLAADDLLAAWQQQHGPPTEQEAARLRQVFDAERQALAAHPGRDGTEITAAGVLLGCVGALAGSFAVMMNALAVYPDSLASGLLAGLGLQLLLLVGAGVYTWRRQQRGLLIGIIIGGSVSVLLQSACVGVLGGLGT